MDFSDKFTRMPQRAQDCPGVLDYASANSALMSQLQRGAFDVLQTPADMSDHLPLALSLEVSVATQLPDNLSASFASSCLRKLKLPKDGTQWADLDDELRTHPQFQQLIGGLRDISKERVQNSDSAQESVDGAVNTLTTCLYETFSKFDLVSKRAFKNQGRKPEGASYAAPEPLRELRRAESHARAAYFASLRHSADPESIRFLKHRWNHTVGKCRKLAKAVRAGFCSDWRALWDKLRKDQPRQMWSTLRLYTSQRPEEITCTRDDQFKHWSTQADVEEAVWSLLEKQ
jgi:hypothetical protein